MPDRLANFEPQDFEPKTRMPEEYCSLAKILIKAADLLDDDDALSPSQRVVTNIHISHSLSDWLRYKASVLDRHFQVWENEEKRIPDSIISQMGGAVEVTEKQFSHALAVAREVIIFHEKHPVIPTSLKDKIRAFFFGPVDRSGEDG
jgi:hypothetical protein